MDTWIESLRRELKDEEERFRFLAKQKQERQEMRRSRVASSFKRITDGGATPETVDVDGEEESEFLVDKSYDTKQLVPQTPSKAVEEEMDDILESNSDDYRSVSEVTQSVSILLVPEGEGNHESILKSIISTDQSEEEEVKAQKEVIHSTKSWSYHGDEVAKSEAMVESLSPNGNHRFTLLLDYRRQLFDRGKVVKLTIWNSSLVQWNSKVGLDQYVGSNSLNRLNEKIAHELILENGYILELLLANSIVSMFVKHGDYGIKSKLFIEIPEETHELLIGIPDSFIESLNEDVCFYLHFVHHGSLCDRGKDSEDIRRYSYNVRNSSKLSFIIQNSGTIVISGSILMHEFGEESVCGLILQLGYLLVLLFGNANEFEFVTNGEERNASKLLNKMQQYFWIFLLLQGARKTDYKDAQALDQMSSSRGLGFIGDAGFVLIKKWIRKALISFFHSFLWSSATQDGGLDRILKEGHNPANSWSPQVIRVLQLEEGIPWLHVYFFRVVSEWCNARKQFVKVLEIVTTGDNSDGLQLLVETSERNRILMLSLTWMDIHGLIAAHGYWPDSWFSGSTPCMSAEGGNSSTAWQVLGKILQGEFVCFVGNKVTNHQLPGEISSHPCFTFIGGVLDRGKKCESIKSSYFAGNYDIHFDTTTSWSSVINVCSISMSNYNETFVRELVNRLGYHSELQSIDPVILVWVKNGDSDNDSKLLVKMSQGKSISEGTMTCLWIGVAGIEKIQQNGQTRGLLSTLFDQEVWSLNDSGMCFYRLPKEIFRLAKEVSTQIAETFKIKGELSWFQEYASITRHTYLSSCLNDSGMCFSWHYLLPTSAVYARFIIQETVLMTVLLSISSTIQTEVTSGTPLSAYSTLGFEDIGLVCFGEMITQELSLVFAIVIETVSGYQLTLKFMESLGTTSSQFIIMVIQNSYLSMLVISLKGKWILASFRIKEIVSGILMGSTSVLCLGSNWNYGIILTCGTEVYYQLTTILTHELSDLLELSSPHFLNSLLLAFETVAVLRIQERVIVIVRHYRWSCLCTFYCTWHGTSCCSQMTGSCKFVSHLHYTYMWEMVPQEKEDYQRTRPSARLVRIHSVTVEVNFLSAFKLLAPLKWECICFSLDLWGEDKVILLGVGDVGCHTVILWMINMREEFKQPASKSSSYGGMIYLKDLEQLKVNLWLVAKRPIPCQFLNATDTIEKQYLPTVCMIKKKLMVTLQRQKVEASIIIILVSQRKTLSVVEIKRSERLVNSEVIKFMSSSSPTTNSEMIKISRQKKFYVLKVESVTVWRRLQFEVIVSNNLGVFRLVFILEDKDDLEGWELSYPRYGLSIMLRAGRIVVSSLCLWHVLGTGLASSDVVILIRILFCKGDYYEIY